MATKRKLAPLTGFAEACYNNHLYNIDELISILETGLVDRVDCDAWKLGDDEWREAIGLALRHKIVDAQK